MSEFEMHQNVPSADSTLRRNKKYQQMIEVNSALLEGGAVPVTPDLAKQFGVLF